jgi:hypothetical protein
MNSTLFFVFCIVTVALAANIIQTMIKQKKKQPDNNQELEETMAKIELLEERIRVLERIITENRFDLKREIDSL